MTNKNTKTKKHHKKAQHFVELVIFLPFLIGILGILSEFGYSISSGYKVESSLPRAVITSSRNIRNAINSDNTVISNEIRDNLIHSLQAQKTPYTDSINIDGFFVDDYFITIATYQYEAAFFLTRMILPSPSATMSFQALHMTNASHFKINDYPILDANLNSDFVGHIVVDQEIPSEEDTNVGPGEDTNVGPGEDTNVGPEGDANVGP